MLVATDPPRRAPRARPIPKDALFHLHRSEFISTDDGGIAATARRTSISRPAFVRCRIIPVPTCRLTKADSFAVNLEGHVHDRHGNVLDTWAMTMG